MKIRRGTARTVDAAKLVAASESLRDQHETLTGLGWHLKTGARAYACKDGSLSIQVVWTKREPGLTSTFTSALRVAP